VVGDTSEMSLLRLRRVSSGRSSSSAVSAVQLILPFVSFLGGHNRFDHGYELTLLDIEWSANLDSAAGSSDKSSGRGMQRMSSTSPERPKWGTRTASYC